MVKECYEYLRNVGGVAEIATEVPCSTGSIDMVLKTGNNRLIIIEFKLKNWRKAISQAKGRRLYPDQIYICLPFRRNIGKLLENELRKTGVGLCFYHRGQAVPISVVVPASQNKHMVKEFRAMMIDQITKVEVR